MKNRPGLKPQQMWVMGIFFFLLLLMAAGACRKEPTAPTGLTPYTLKQPAGFPPQGVPPDNQPYAERVALGRKLYYDQILSNTGQSCSSCHLQEVGFTVHRAGGIPVLPHINLGWRSNYMWDGSKTGTLEDVMLFEVEEFFATDISRLQEDGEYRKLFRESYQVETISSYDVARALAQFARALVSAESPFDRHQRGQNALTPAQLRGLEIFNSQQAACFHCHTPPLFTNDDLHNIGLDSSYNELFQQGHFQVTGDSADLGRFRTPTLRNVALRNRFMHDGRFSSLREVIEFYNEGILMHQRLDPALMRGNQPMRLGLQSAEIDDLVAFLESLTDNNFITDPELSDPGGS